MPITLRVIYTSISLCLSLASISGQFTPAVSQQEGGVSHSYLEHISAKNIGPSVFGGRVVDLAINPDNTTEFFVAYASGGLWYTNNNGTTYEPRFDDQAVMTIGDIDVDWQTGTIVLGSGEVNSSRSSYAGNGIYKSEDMGVSWTYQGLPESHHIGRVIIMKDNPKIINIAVLGHLYTANPERGMYRSTDGGLTWTRTLFVNENAGAVDLVAHPNDASILYCSIWERTRRAWDFTESGTGSGMYKSVDAGATWQKISNTVSGFPQGEGTGRIGLAIHSDSDQTKIYALLDNQNRRPKEENDNKDELTKDEFASMDQAQFAKLDNAILQTYLDENGLKDHTAQSVKKQVANGEIAPVALKEYVEDANRMLFDTPVIGAEVYVSTDEGTTWSKTHDGYIDGLYYSYGYYFGQISVNPENSDQLYILGVPILRSDDGGKQWKNINGDNVHVDHHALWINPKQPSHIINGNDGGINISYDHGEHWTKPNSPPVGQFYTVNVDQAENYKVYGGTQDNGVWTGKADYERGTKWQMTGKYPYEIIMGGDGMQVQIDSRDNATVYTGYQFGNYFRMGTDGGSSYITPKHKLGDRPYRWNWQSPILLSPHNQDIVYFGANKLMRSMDQGTTFTEISEDLTYGGKQGDVAYGTLTTISESILEFGLIYVGSDDGRVHVTKDGGHSWKEISMGLPDSLWISRIWASAHDKQRVYVSVNGYRNDIFTPMVYRSDDTGKTWQPIFTDLPTGPVNIVREDKTDENVIYVGTDHGCFVSIDQGHTFMQVGKLPNVPVHDLAIHQPTGDMLIGTHGRSIYKINLSLFYQAIKSDKPLLISGVTDIRHNSNWGKRKRTYDDPVKPELLLEVFSKNGGTGTMTVSTANKTLYSKDITLPQGISTLTYDLTASSKYFKNLKKLIKKQDDEEIKVGVSDDGNHYLPPGEYDLKLTTGTQTATHNLNIVKK